MDSFKYIIISYLFAPIWFILKFTWIYIYTLYLTEVSTPLTFL